MAKILLIFSIFIFILTSSCTSTSSKKVITQKPIHQKPVSVDKDKESVISKPKKRKLYIPPPPPVVDLVEEEKGFSVLDKKLVSISVNQAPLGFVFMSVAKDLGMNVVISQEVNKNVSITVNFNNTPARQVLDIISDMGNVYYEIKGNVIYVKAIKTEIFHIPYVKAVSNYNVNLGGDVLGSTSLAGGGGGFNTFGTTNNFNFPQGTGAFTGGAGGTGLQGNFTLNYKTEDEDNDLFEQVEDNIKALLSENGNVVINKMTGTVMITDYVSNIKKVKEFLTKLRELLSKQVLIEAKIVEVSLNDRWQYGIDWGLLLRNVGGGNVSFIQNLATNAGYGQVVVVGKDFASLLDVLAEAGKLETLSNPRIRVLNGQSAIISTGTIIPFWEKQLQTLINQGGTQQTLTYSRTSVLDGILLGVLPHINEDGTITMNIVPVSTSLRGTKQLIENNQILGEAPVLEVKEAGTIVKVKDGDTVIIGGLMSKYRETVERKIPVLGDIPLLGYLFKQKQNVETKKELIIFIRPRIINLDFDEFNN